MANFFKLQNFNLFFRDNICELKKQVKYNLEKNQLLRPSSAWICKQMDHCVNSSKACQGVPRSTNRFSLCQVFGNAHIQASGHKNSRNYYIIKVLGRREYGTFQLMYRDIYTYRVLQTIQMKLILLCVWAERDVFGSAKTALKFKHEI